MTQPTTPFPAPTIGFIGLGLLGQAMALRLAQAGFDLIVWNREPERCAALRAAGAEVADSPQDLAARSTTICLCVTDGNAVHDVLFGPRGLASAARERRSIIDFSTVDPTQTRNIAAQAEESGFSWVDAPVSGGPSAALSGQLTIMCGGSPEMVARAKPVLDAVSSRCTHVGGAGSGQELKVLNQALVGGTAVLLAEVLTLARGLGLPTELVPACLEGGLADSAALQRLWPRMATEQHDPPIGRASQMLKDLKNVDTLRAGSGLTLPMVQAAFAQYATYVETHQLGDAETFSIDRLYRL